MRKRTGKRGGGGGGGGWEAALTSTTPLVAQMPSDVAPFFTASKAYSIWGSVVREARSESEARKECCNFAVQEQEQSGAIRERLGMARERTSRFESP